MKWLRDFFQAQSAGGIVLALAALVALVLSNSPLDGWYQSVVQMVGEIRIGSDSGSGAFVLSKPLLVWVNDLWMAVFFFLVGLEIKREFVGGELSRPRQAALPAVAALGGMAVPALIFIAINRGDAVALRGWAIPSATDIAFALGVLTLLGSRVPQSLKVFLTAVAIIDDLGAIVVIALFYTAHLSWPMLGGAAVCVLILMVLNRLDISVVAAYLLVGAVLWLFVLKSGVHATLAGVVTALAVPVATRSGDAPLARAEHALHAWVAFGILPVFAFANAGVSLRGLSWSILVEPVPLGIALGLLIGKPVGIFGSTWLMARLGMADRPSHASWSQMFGLSLLCGIGFTMSLFIGGLAYRGHELLESEVKLGVLAGSLLSAALGAWWLSRARPGSRLGA